MIWLWPMLASMLIGLALSQQPAINGATSGVLDSAFAAAAFSLTISAFMVATVFWLSGAPTRAVQFFELPWWSGSGRRDRRAFRYGWRDAGADHRGCGIFYLSYRWVVAGGCYRGCSWSLRIGKTGPVGLEIGGHCACICRSRSCALGLNAPIATVSFGEEIKCLTRCFRRSGSDRWI